MISWLKCWIGLTDSMSKYLSKKVTVDGIEFDSKKEANHYLELKQQERQGLISDLQLQVPFVLIPAQYVEEKTVTKSGKEKIIKKLIERKVQYIADFVYTCDGKIVVEDVKGYKRGGAYSTYVLKRKLLLWRYGIKIIEI